MRKVKAEIFNTDHQWQDVAGIFHQWGNHSTEYDNGPANDTVAIIELENGEIVTCIPEKVTFIVESKDTILLKNEIIQVLTRLKKEMLTCMSAYRHEINKSPNYDITQSVLWAGFDESIQMADLVIAKAEKS